jgi:caffeoyl-CoA O-methyltransferase
VGTKARIRSIRSYALGQSTPPSALAQELYDDAIATFGLPDMSCGPVEGALLQTLVASMGAKRVLEIGTFAGFSALMMAESLPDDGKLITCEMNPAHAAFARSYFDRSPHGRKIDMRVGPASETLQTLGGSFDFAFLDADKREYVQYYEATLPLLRPGALLAADDALLGGPNEPLADRSRGVAAFNERVRDDDRVSQVLLTVRSGILLVRKL